MKKNIIKILLSIFMIIISIISYVFFLWTNVENNKIKNVLTLLDDYLLYNWLLKETWNEIVILRIDDKTVNEFQTNDTNIFSMTKKTHWKIIEKLFEDYNISNLWIDIIFWRKWEEKDILYLENVLDKYNNRIVIWSQLEWLKPLCEYKENTHWIVKIISEDRIRKTKISYDNYNDLCSNTKYSLNWFWFEIFNQYIGKLNLFQKYDLFTKYSDTFYEKDTFIKTYSKKKDELNDILFNDSLSKVKNNEIFFSFHKVDSREILKDNIYWFESYSLHDIYKWNKIDKYWNEIDLNWKIVLIWEVWSSFHDEFYSPIDFNNKMSGVEFHANIIATLLNKTFLNNIEVYVLVILLILYSFILSSLFFIKLRFWIILLLIYILINIFIWKMLINFSWEIFFLNKEFFYIYPVSFFIFYWIVFFLAIYGYKYIEEIVARKLYLKKYNLAIKDKDFIKNAFSQYINPKMVDAIIKDPNKLKLWWEKKELTIFFSDLVWFTSISESMDSKSLFTFLNIYFDEMWRILTKNNGTIDKYIWDALMWFYGAPLDIDKPEFKACITALEQVVKLKELNAMFKRHKPEFLDIAMRIWINTWDTSHWNLWWKNNINYTVIWDSVNLASRLEAVNKQYWTTICLSESTYLKVKDDFIFRELDTIRVKWKMIWIKIYELVWEKLNNINLDFIVNYEEWLKFYYEWKNDEAISCFEKNLNDETSKIMIERCKDFKLNDTKLDNWVYVMKTK